jgi:hypothetical protein
MSVLSGRYSQIPKTGITKNKAERVGMFSPPKKHQTKHHIYHTFHHKLTTFLPPQNAQKSQNPLQKPPFPPLNIFPPKQVLTLTFPPSKPIRNGRGPHSGSEVVLPYPAPQT